MALLLSVRDSPTPAPDRAVGEARSQRQPSQRRRRRSNSSLSVNSTLPFLRCSQCDFGRQYSVPETLVCKPRHRNPSGLEDRPAVRPRALARASQDRAPGGWGKPTLLPEIPGLAAVGTATGTFRCSGEDPDSDRGSQTARGQTVLGMMPGPLALLRRASVNFPPLAVR